MSGMNRAHDISYFILDYKVAVLTSSLGYTNMLQPECMKVKNGDSSMKTSTHYLLHTRDVDPHCSCANPDPPNFVNACGSRPDQE